MPATARGLRLLTLNVNSLGGPSRAAAHLHFIVRCCGDPDIVCLQELKLSDHTALLAALATGRGPALPYHAAAFSSLGSDAARGVAILVRDHLPQATLPPDASYRDAEGRVVRVDLSVGSYQLSILSVYAPNQQQGAFFESLLPALPAGRLCLVGGDFNCITDSLDQSNDGGHRLAGAAQLRSLMSAAGLVDPFRAQNPTQRAYTHVGTNRASAARLDRWLVSEACLPQVQSVCHRDGGPGDHAGVLLHLSLPGLPSLGPGLRALPTQVLYIPALCTPLTTELELFIAGLPQPTGPFPRQRRWALIKSFLLTTAIAKNRAYLRQQAAARRAAEARFRAEAAALAAAASADSSAVARYAAERDRLQRAVGAEFGRAAQATSAVWREQGERCTAWHFAQAKTYDHADPIASLRYRNGVAVDLSGVVSGAAVSALAAEHFASDSQCGLYRVGQTDATAQDYLLGQLQRVIPPSLAAAAEGPNGDGSITEACLRAALARCENGKAPGWDGIPYEAYKVLWDVLAAPLTAAMQEVFEVGPAGPGWNEGVIVPVHKGKGLPRDVLDSYRPITLLNCDLKLVSRVLSDRMMDGADFVIDPVQTAFISGRDIGDNVLLQQGLAEYLEREQQPGACVCLDIRQAYDRVDRGWLQRCLTSHGYRTGVRRWVVLLMEGTRSRVLVNGWLTEDFAVNNGLLQGGPLSPLLWNLQLEPLTAAFRRAVEAGALHPPPLPGGGRAPPLTHHADDTKLFMQSVQGDGPVAMELLRKYEQASNALIHPDKSKGSVMGTHAQITGREPITGADFGDASRPPLTALGVPCTTDITAAGVAVYTKRISALQFTARKWATFPLSLFGRVLNAKQVLANQLAYHATFVPPSANYLGQMQDIIADYALRSSHSEDRTVGRGRAVEGRNGGRIPLRPMPPLDLACLSHDLGGCGFPDVRSQVTALQAKVIALAFCPGGLGWKEIMLDALTFAAPHPRWGPVWVLTGVPMPLQPQLPQRVDALVRAMRASGVEPLATDIPPRAVLLAPLYYNSLIHTGGGSTLAPPADAPADWPFTVGQLASAPPAVRAHPALQMAIGHLPDKWREVFDRVVESGEGAYDAEEEWWCSEDEEWVKRRGSGEVFAVVPGGVLCSVPHPPQEDITWQPACVLDVPKPRGRWAATGLEEQDPAAAATEMEAQGLATAATVPAAPDAATLPAATAPTAGAPDTAPAETNAAGRPLMQLLLGKWGRVKVYPPAWGHTVGKKSVGLHQYCVAHVRVGMTQVAAVREGRKLSAGYAPGQPLRPALWVDPDRPGTTGLAALEEGWREAHVRKRQRRDFTLQPLPWMLPRQPQLGSPPSPQPPPLHPQANTAGGAAVATPEAELDEYKEHWRAIKTAPVANRTKTFAYRLAHAALPCNALVGHLYSNKSPDFAFCPLCPAPGGSAPRPIETYTHLFLCCPTYQPAVRWLRDLWVALGGARPPNDARVIIADDLRYWPQAPQGFESLRWQALRLTVLHNIWEARCSANSECRTARAVVLATIAAVRTEIALQFERTHRRSSMELNAPPRAMATRRRLVTDEELEDFKDTWEVPGLCSIAEAAVTIAAGISVAVPELVLQLTAHHPVPAPQLPQPQPAAVASTSGPS